MSYIPLLLSSSLSCESLFYHVEPAPAYGEEELYDDAQTAPVTNYPPEEVYDDAQSNVPQAGLGGEKGVVARALYDYQAG